MKNLKKTLALVVACLMLFGLAATAASPFPDVANDGSPLAEAVEVITALKIVEGDDEGNFNPTSSITRAETAKILCTMVGSGVVGQSVTIFDDVPSSHWASGYIATATGMGYIDGFGDGTFRPDEPVTYEQAVKLLTCALGYRVYADTLGGYPTGYMIAAAEKDVTKNAHGKMSEAATRGTVAIMIYNSINAPVMKQTKWSSTLSEWEFMDGTKGNPMETLLNTQLKGYKVEGVVTVTSTSSLSNTTLKDGYVDFRVESTFGVDGKKIGADDSDISKKNTYLMRNISAVGTGADDLLHYLSTAYLMPNDYDELEIVCIVSKFGKNDVYTIDDASLIYDPLEDSSYVSSRPRDKFSLDAVNTFANDKYIYSYWESSREDETRMKTFVVEDDAVVLWNGQEQGTLSGLSADANPFKADGTWQKNVVRPLVGTVKLIDTNMDGVIDIIDSRNYEVAVVDSVITSNMSVTFKESALTDSTGKIVNRIKLSKDENPELKNVKFMLDGKEIAYTDLEDNDVLNICTNDAANPVFFDVIVTREFVQGAVRTYNASNKSYEVDGWDEPLQVSKGLNTIMDFELGDEGIFYLDMNGNIAYADMNPVLNGEFGYLHSVSNYEWDDIRARIFNKDGAEVSYKVENKVKINNIRISGIDEALTVDQINKIFGFTGTSALTSNNADDYVTSTSTTVSGKLTAKILLQAIAGSKIDGVDYALKAILSDAMVGEAVANRMINYVVGSSNTVTSITLPIESRNASNRFTFVEKATDTQWSVRSQRFQGMRTVADNAIIFVIPGTDISEYKVMSKDMLQDETKAANVYSYCNIKDQGASILLLTKDVVSMGGFGIFSGYLTGMEDGQQLCSISYWTNGEKADNLIAYDDTVDVVGCGISNGVRFMAPGDIFTYKVNSKNEVTDIYVLFRAGTKAPNNFMTSIDLDSASDDTFDSWDYYGEDTALKDKNADNEVYFGIVYKVSGSGTRSIVVVGRDGLQDNGETFTASSTAPVTYYNPARTTSRRLDAASVMDITASACLKDASGDLILTTDASGDILESIAKELTHVFVKLYKDEVDQIVYINYNL